MTDTTIVDRLYLEYQDIVDNLGTVELSLRNSAEETFRKSLLLAAASHFEREIQDHIMMVVRKYSSGDMIVEFVRNKAIKRQYHTYFTWNRRNANDFFGMFGEGYKSYMIDQVQADQTYERSIRAFLELGNERNRLVHQDFGNFPLEKTSEEIFDLYKRARLFVDSIGTSFDEYLQSFSKP